MTFTCEKCGNLDGFPTRLAGGVTTILCPSCSTEWHAYIRDHESLRGLNYANAVMVNAIQRGMLIASNLDPVYYQAQRLHSRHSKILFDVALDWLGRASKGE